MLAVCNCGEDPASQPSADAVKARTYTVDFAVKHVSDDSQRPLGALPENESDNFAGHAMHSPVTISAKGLVHPAGHIPSTCLTSENGQVILQACPWNMPT